MTIKRLLYQSLFDLPRAPAPIRPVFAEAQPPRILARKLIAVAAATAQFSAFVPNAPPVPGPASTDLIGISVNPISSSPISGARLGDTTVAFRPLPFADVQVQRVKPFAAAQQQFSCFIGSPPAAPAPQSLAISIASDVVVNVNLPYQSLFYAPQPITQVVVQPYGGAFTEPPIQRAAPLPSFAELQGWYGFVRAPVVARAAAFAEHPTVRAPPASSYIEAQNWQGFVRTPSVTFVGPFTQGLEPSRRRANAFDPVNFAMAFIRAATPSALTFTPSPELFVKPFGDALQQSNGFVNFPPAAPATQSLATSIESDLVVNVCLHYQSLFYAPQPITQVVQPYGGAFSASPDLRRQPISRLELAGFTTAPFSQAYGATFSASPNLFKPSPVQAVLAGAPFVSRPVSFSPGQPVYPDIVRRTSLLPDQLGFVSTFRIAATPTALGFSASPEQNVKPFAATKQQFACFIGSPPAAGPTQSFATSIDSDVVVNGSLPYQSLFYAPQPITQVVVQPYGGAFSASPSLSIKAFPAAQQQGAGFVNTPVVVQVYGGAFIAHPEPRQRLQPRIELAGFVTVPFTAPQGWQSPSPHVALRRQAVADQPGFVPAPFTQAFGGAFSQPLELRPRRGLPRDAGFVSSFIIAATPSSLTFSPSPERKWTTRYPGLDTYHFVEIITYAATPGPLVFSPSPEQRRKPRVPGLDATHFVSSFRIAATPSALVFSPSPERRWKTRNSGLDATHFVSSFRIAATPGPLVFSPSPERRWKTRIPGLDATHFVSSFRIAATPSALVFTPSPHLFTGRVSVTKLASAPVFPFLPPQPPPSPPSPGPIEPPRLRAPTGAGSAGPSRTPDLGYARTGRSHHSLALRRVEMDILLAQMSPEERKKMQIIIDDEDIAYLLLNMDKLS